MTETDEIETKIPARRAKGFIERYQKLRECRSTLDYELAGLAAEIRQEFPAGASGWNQCRLWMSQNLDIHGQTAVMLSRAARAFILFPEEGSWTDIGGWSSMGFLLGFSARDRRRIHAHARKLVEERGRPCGYATVRNVAHLLGCKQSVAHGRPNRLAVEENLGILRAYVLSLISDGTVNPETMNEGVIAALKSTKLANIADAVRA